MDTIYLVEVTGLKLSDSTAKTFYFCTGRGWVSSATDTPPLQSYTPRVLQPGNLKSSMFQDGKTGGASSIGYGDVSLVNNDGGLDYLTDYSFNGRSIVIKSVTEYGVAVLYTGTLEQPLYSMNTVSLMVRDRQITLNQPLQSTLYLGANTPPNGVEGGDDIKGKPKPRVYGTVFNVAPVLVNASLLIYQISDKPVYGVDIFDNGIELDQSGDVASVAALESATVAAGTYLMCSTSGLFRLGSAPVGTVTADVSSGNGISPLVVEMVDSSAKIYQLSMLSGIGFLLENVFANGGSLSKGPACTTMDALAVVSIPAGQYATLSLDGPLYIRPAASASTPIAATGRSCADAAGVSPVECAVAILNDFGIVDINMPSVVAAHNAVPYRAGLYINGSDTVASLLDILAASASCWYNYDEFGRVTFHPVSFSPSLEIPAELNKSNLITIEKVATQDDARGVPAYRHNVHYSKCYTVQTQGLAGGASPERVAFVSQEYRSFFVEDQSIKQRHLLSPERSWDTALTTFIAADAEAIKRLNLFGVERSRLSANVVLSQLKYPKSGVWASGTLPQLPTPRFNMTTVKVGNVLYVLGGRTLGGSTLAGCFKRDMSRDENLWEALPSLPYPVEQSAAVVYNNKIYLFGGYAMARNLTSRYSATLCLDLNNLAAGWVAAISNFNLPYQLYGHAAVLKGSEVIISGGVPYSGSVVSAVVMNQYLNEPFVWATSFYPALPVARANHASFIDSDGSIYIVGGRDRYGAGLISCYSVISGFGSWAALPDLPAGRHSFGFQQSGNKIYVVGGVEYGNLLADILYSRDVSNNSDWKTELIRLPQKRSAMIVNIDPANVYDISFFGGYTANITDAAAYTFQSNYSPKKRANLYKIGATVLVKLPRYGWDTGKPFIIIGCEIDYATDQIMLDLWG